jgi:hypothetical protein
MDTSEKLVADFLAHSGYTNVVFEPDGNVTPDFLVQGRIAIEVRRLNQNYEGEGATKGLEEVSIPLRQKFERLVTSLGPPIRNESWFVSFHFRRPIEPWSALKLKLRVTLLDFMNSTKQQDVEVSLGNAFELNIFRASNPHASFYVMAGYTDRDSGGWLVSEIMRNLRICVNQKTNNLAKVRAKYAEWWLVLVDHIGHGLDDLDRQQLHAQVTAQSLSPDWRKIILVDPHDHTRSFEI